MFLFFSCKKSNGDLQVGTTTILNTNPVANDNIPYTDTATLNIIAKNKNFVDYKLAHKLAIIEMGMSINQQMGWNGAKLSPLPVVVYDAKSNPKYYEFIVKKQDGTQIGTITSAAKKEVGGSVAFVVPSVRDYNFVSAKGPAYKMISAGYPNRVLVGLLGKGGNMPSGIIDPTTGGLVASDDILTEDAQGEIDAINALPQTTLDSLGTDAPTMVSSVQQQATQNLQQAGAFWQMTDSLNTAIANLSDDAIEAIINASKGTYTSSDQFVVPAFRSQQMQSTYWDGWCGPSDIALIYRAYNDNYRGFHLPLAGDADFQHANPSGYYDRYMKNGVAGEYFFNDANGNHQMSDRVWVRDQSNSSDGGLYNDIAVNSGTFWWNDIFHTDNGPTLPWFLSSSLLYASHGFMFLRPLPYITFMPIPLSTPGHAWLRTQQTPMLCWTDWFSHYQVAIGSQIDFWNWNFIINIWFIHINWTVSIPTNRWLLMQDNGYTTSSNGYKAYWKNDLWNFDIQYPVIKL